MSEDKDIRKAEFFLEAERQARKDHPPEPKRRWLKTKCPNCGYKIEYSSKENWDGELRCPEYEKIFKVIRLDEFA